MLADSFLRNANAWDFHGWKMYLSYKAQFLLWGQYWQICLLVRMSGSLDKRLRPASFSTQLWMWWTKVFLSFSSSEINIEFSHQQWWRTGCCERRWRWFCCIAKYPKIIFWYDCPQPVLGRLGKHMWVYCTSAVHVAGHYRVQVASLEVKQEASFSIVSLHAHQRVKNDLHT